MTNINDSTVDRLRSLIRNVADFPKPGIVFRDITPLLADGQGLDLACRTMAEPFVDKGVELVTGAESRGFIFGVAIAQLLGCGFVPIRKPGKLPAATISQEYDLEYGTDKLEMHADAVKPGRKILMVDDLLATGGTMKACCQMVEKLKGDIVGISFLVELSFLNGKEKLNDYTINSVITYNCE